MKKILAICLLVIISMIGMSTVHAQDDIDYEEIFENHKSVMLIIDPDTGVIYYANPAAVDFYGYSREILIGMNIDEINTLTSEEVAEERLNAADEERNFFVFKHELANGDIRTVHVYSYPVQINDETYLFSIVIDQTTLALTEQRNKTLIIIAVSMLGLGLITTGILFLNLIEKHKKLKESEQRFEILHNASFGGIAIHDQGYILDCNQGLSDITGYSINELIGMNGLLLIAPDYREYVMNKIKSGYEEPYEAYGIRKNDEIYPLKLEARNIPYHNKQVRVVEFRDRTTHKQNEKEKEESERRYQLLFSTMNQGVVFHDSDGYITSCNPKAEEILGLSLDEMQGKTTMDPRWKMMDENHNRISGENHPSSIALKTKEKVGPVIRAVYRPDLDEHIWLKIIAIPLFVEGEEKPHQVYATFEDITKMRETENKLNERNKMIESLFSNMITGTVIYDVMNDGKQGKDYIIKEMNDVSLTWEGKKRSEVVGKPITDFHPNIEKTGIIEEFRKVWKTGEPISSSTKQFINGGYNRWHDNHIFKLSSGEIVAMYDDVTDQVHNRKALEESRERLKLVMDNLPIGIAVNSVKPSVEFSYMNDNFAKIYGVDREELEKEGHFWDAVYMDEVFRKKIKRKVLEAIESGDVNRMEWENIPIKHKGEKTRYISASDTPIPNSDLFISTVMDVTNQRNKQKAIQYASNHDSLTGLPNRRYFDEMLEKYDCSANYPLGIAMMDLNRLKLINDAYGHAQGDIALKRIAKTLNENIRENDFIARIGGDEFALLCPNIEVESAERLKFKIIKKIHEIKINDIKLSMSIGYDVKNHGKESINQVLINAEDDMYKNKSLYHYEKHDDPVSKLLDALKSKYQEEQIHSDRVSNLCAEIGEALNLRPTEIIELRMAGLYHDIGKITIPDAVLTKPGKLNDEEWDIMKKHTINGYQILRSAHQYTNIAEYAMSHHERIDGKGYPNGLKGEEIPLFSRIISVADAYEAMTADRVYRKAMNKNKAIEELKNNSGTQFDSEITDVFINKVLHRES